MPKSATDLIGGNTAFRKALSDAATAARQDSPVLIYGETGSGKGVIAEYIHRRSGRTGRLVSVNCATFQPNLFESELFGHVRGAFTGAIRDSAGLFEAANGGTLFLDEIGDTPLEIQPKLLRAIEQGLVRRVGGTRETSVDVRLIFATNFDLEKQIEAGKFRQDLFYRISPFMVRLPALRERREDILDLARHFLAEASPRALTLAPDAEKALLDYAWPGNVRELRSAMAFAAAQCSRREQVLATDLPEAVLRPAALAATRPAHEVAFIELYRTGAQDARLWAEFLLALNGSLGTNRFARQEILDCLRAARGPEPSANALVNEWTRHIKPVALRLRLIHEEGKKLRINLDACRAALADAPIDDEPDTETATQAPPSLSVRSRRTNLYAARTSFVGRQGEVQQLSTAIRGGARLVTVTGPGGTGKTRLAREVGNSLLSDFEGGIWFASLTQTRNVEGLAYAVAQAFGMPLSGNHSPELEVAEHLRARGRCLVVLDNFEQLVHAAPTIGDWLAAAPNASFLVTSRALLGLGGEQQFDLQPLALPAEGDALEVISRNESVRLFVDRARVHHLGFELDAKSAAAVARICRRVEGMPLAIELAAARTVIMQPEQIAQKLDNLFAMLKSSRRDLQPRQQSLAATLDWSFDLLTEPERWAFGQLSVFGGLFLDAAEQVLDMSKFPSTPGIIDLVQGLREKSLLRATDTPYETRISTYQVVREYAARKWAELASPAEQQTLLARHAEYYRRYLALWDSRLSSVDSVEALARLDYERANTALLLEFAHNKPDPVLFAEVTLHTARLLRVRGPARQRVPAITAALAVLGPGDTPHRARLLFLLGQAERESGDPARAHDFALEAVEVAMRVGDETLVATARFNLAGMEYDSGNATRAQELHQEVLPVFRRLGNRLNEARVLSRMALVGAELGEFDAAVEHSRRAEFILREEGDMPGVAFVLSNRGTILNRRGRHEQALALMEQAERMYREQDDKRMVGICLSNRALISRQLRRFADAETQVLECIGLSRELGDRVMLAKNLMNAGIMYMELARYDDAARVLREAEPMFTAQSNPRLRAVCIENLAYIEGMQGRLEGAIAGLREAAALCQGQEGEETLAGIRAAHAEVLLHHGRAGEALPEARLAAEFWKGREDGGRDQFRALAALAQARALQADHNGAAANAKSALELAATLHFTESDSSPFIPAVLRILKKLSAG